MEDKTEFYVSDGQGRYFLDDGSGDYVPAPAGISVEEVKGVDGKGTGRFIRVRDAVERAHQLEPTSHEKYFEKLAASKDPREARRAMKRLDAFEKQFQQMVIDSASPVGVPSVEYVKDEKAMDLLEQYRRDKAAGRTKDPTYAESMFIPLAEYQHKLVTKSGTIIRPVYSGELGIVGPKILCLEAGYGTGTRS